MKNLLFIFLSVVVASVSVADNRDIFPQSDRPIYRLPPSGFLPSGAGTGDGGLLYWDDDDSVWRGSDADQLSWDDANDVLAATNVTVTGTGIIGRLLAGGITSEEVTGNNFSEDPNCAAVWNLDNGALTVDSRGTNTLTNSGVSANVGDFKEGDASGSFVSVSTDYLNITDASLDAGFPLKNGDTNKKISATCWVKFTSLPGTGGFMAVTTKYNSATSQRSWGLFARNVGGITKFVGIIGHNSGVSREEMTEVNLILATGVWYHVGFTFQDSDKAWKIRAWDDNAQAVTESSGTTTNNIFVTNVAFNLGRNQNPSLWMNGLIDELVVFKDILTSGEIDEIRNDEYLSEGVDIGSSVHVFSAEAITPQLIADSSDNVLVAGDVEIQEDLFVVNITASDTVLADTITDGSISISGGTLDMNDGFIINTGYIIFDPDFTNGSMENRLSWNDDDGTLNLGMKGGFVNQQIGLESLIRGKNVTGTGTTDGRPARISGGSGTPPFAEISFSDANDPAAAGSIGLFTEDINNNALGYVTTFGMVRDIDTSGTPVSEVWAAGDRIYVSNDVGELTNVAPTGNERIIFVGSVIRAHATEGEMWVSTINTPYLHELSGVQSSPADNDMLQYDSASGVWENTKVIEGLTSVTASGLGMFGELQVDLVNINGATISGLGLNILSDDQSGIGSGAITVETGTTDDNSLSGGIDIFSGNAPGTDGDTGDISLSTGDADDNSGNILINTGTARDIASLGTIQLFIGGDLALLVDGNKDFDFQAGNVDTDGTINLATLGCVGTGNYFLGDPITSSSITTGENNMSFGAGAGASLEDAVQCVNIGWLAGEDNVSGNNNMFIGGASGAKCLTSRCVGVGFGSVGNLVGGIGDNIGIGNNSCKGAATGSPSFDNCVGIGSSTGGSLTAATDIIMIGTGAGAGITSGTHDILIGDECGDTLSTQIGNTFVGSRAGRDITGAGSHFNTLIGYLAALDATGGSNGIFIGSQAGRRQSSTTGKLIISSYDQGSDALELTDSIIYGLMKDNDPASQTLALNAAVTIPHTLTVGDGTNEMVISATGDMSFEGDATVWDDLRVPVSAVRVLGPAGTFPPVVTAFKGGFTLAFEDQAVNEQTISFSAQLPHSYKEGTDITAHIHWTPEDNTAGNVAWEFTHSWANEETVFPGETTVNVTTAADTTTDKHQTDLISTMDGTGKTISSMLICSLTRNSSDASDTYNGLDAYLHEIDFHFEKDTVGSRTVLTK